MQMAELTLSGTVTDVTDRSGNSERGPWRIVTAYLVGTRRAYEVTLPDDLVGVVNVGDELAFAVYPRVFNGNVTFTATGLAS